MVPVTPTRNLPLKTIEQILALCIVGMQLTTDDKMNTKSYNRLICNSLLPSLSIGSRITAHG